MLQRIGSVVGFLVVAAIAVVWTQYYPYILSFSSAEFSYVVYRNDQGAQIAPKRVAHLPINVGIPLPANASKIHYQKTARGGKVVRFQTAFSFAQTVAFYEAHAKANSFPGRLFKGRQTSSRDDSFVLFSDPGGQTESGRAPAMLLSIKSRVRSTYRNEVEVTLGVCDEFFYCSGP